MSRSGTLILFILLELISFVLIVTLNPKQSSSFQKSAHELGGSFSEARHSVFSYFSLTKQNLGLQDENARLNSEIVKLRQKVIAYRFRFPYSREYAFPQDSLMAVNHYSLIPARVINNSTQYDYNYLTLNKGAAHGIEKNMGVFSPSGVAGVVISVSQHYSLAQSVLNKNFHLSARVRSNQSIGTLSWEGGDPNEGLLNFIPQTSPLSLGDTVLSSGYSGVFPEDFMIGVVSRIKENQHTGFYNISVRFSTQFRSLDQVYLIKHQFRNEIDSLEQQVPK